MKMATSTINLGRPVTLDDTGTTSSSGSIELPDAVKQGTYVTAYTIGKVTLIFRRDADWMMVKDASIPNSLTPLANTQITVRYVYYPA